ncbi:MAG: DNA cytosine methyltransferase [Desulfobacteraceae bacterium]|nr:DNA cytosine methyltransferase [Desulfobacteraceae bacterium]
MNNITDSPIKSFIDDELIYLARLNSGLIGRLPLFGLIDAFSGAGGMTLGFSNHFKHSFQPVWANDFNRESVETYNANFGNHCLQGDINDILGNRKNHIPNADVVIGGPPCQGFSLLNKKRENDPRKQLWRPFLSLVSRSQATVFVMENVPQLINSDEQAQIIDEATNLGFKTASAILCAADYGVPQVRWRAFIIGCKHEHPSCVFPPKKTHYLPDGMKVRRMFSDNGVGYINQKMPWKTVADAIGNLPAPHGCSIRKEPPPFNLHFGRTPTEISMKRYRAIPEEGMNRFDLQRCAPEITPECWIKKKSGGTDLFGRLWWNRPAYTIRTEFFKPEKGRYLHPEQHRPITHREAARLQTFTDSFVFTGSKIEIAKQIGNAVPPCLAARVADSVTALLIRKAIKHG